MNARPCPWLIESAGAIDPSLRRSIARCGASAERHELTVAMRTERCLVGAACEVRAERERALGSLASSLAPLQPIGDSSLFVESLTDSPQRRPAPWRAALLVLLIAGVAAFGSGPALSALSSLVGSGGAGESANPSAVGTASESPSATPTPGESVAASASPSAPPPPSPTASAGSGRTYVVQRGDTLYKIGLTIEGGYKVLAELNGIKGPDYTIFPGQVLKLP